MVVEKVATLHHTTELLAFVLGDALVGVHASMVGKCQTIELSGHHAAGLAHAAGLEVLGGGVGILHHSVVLCRVRHGTHGVAVSLDTPPGGGTGQLVGEPAHLVGAPLALEK